MGTTIHLIWICVWTPTVRDISILRMRNTSKLNYLATPLCSPTNRLTDADISKYSTVQAVLLHNCRETILRYSMISTETSSICIGVRGSSRRSSAESCVICSFEYMKQMLHSQAVLPDVRRTAERRTTWEKQLPSWLSENSKRESCG